MNDLIHIKHMISEYEAEISRLEEEQGDGDHYCDEIEQEEEKKSLYDFALELAEGLIKEGFEFKHADSSSASEAEYFDVYNGEVFLKLRIATHYSNYNKDVNIVADSFRRYRDCDLQEAIDKVKAKFEEIKLEEEEEA